MHQPLEPREGDLDWVGAGHVDAGVLKQLERPLGATALEERQVVVEFRLPPAMTRSLSAIAAERPVAYL